MDILQKKFRKMNRVNNSKNLNRNFLLVEM